MESRSAGRHDLVPRSAEPDLLRQISLDEVCYSFVQTGNETPNIYGVTLLGDRQPFERMYVGFTNSTSDFKLHRLSINASNGRPWNRTRILPVDSGDASHKNEVEFVQAGNHLYIFEGSKMHTIYLYY